MISCRVFQPIDDFRTVFCHGRPELSFFAHTLVAHATMEPLYHNGRSSCGPCQTYDLLTGSFGLAGRLPTRARPAGNKQGGWN
jgi:hypothetical protein